MKLTSVVFLLLSSVAALAGSASNQGASRIWITDVAIISPENLDHIGQGNVLIEDGRIVSVERNKRTKKPAGATVVSGKGQFLIPGLIDSHVHLASIPGVQLEMSFGPDAAKPSMIGEYLKQLPRSYLYFGYTTLVDLAVVERRVLDEFWQAPLHPDLYDCGQSLRSPMATRCRSHPWQHAFSSFPTSSTILSKPPVSLLNTSRRITLLRQRWPRSRIPVGFASRPTSSAAMGGTGTCLLSAPIISQRFARMRLKPASS